MKSSPVVNFNYQWPSGPGQSFDLVFRPINSKPLPWREQLIKTADHIGQQALAQGRKLYLCLSGGIDSEVMALAFMAAGHKFTAFTVRHPYNTHDTRYAYRFCTEHSIQQEWADLDITEFHKIYRARGYRAVNLFRYLQLWILEQIGSRGGMAVLGGGEQIYYAENNSLYLKFDPGFVLPLVWLEDHPEQQHWPYFHMTTPELMASYQQIDLIRLLTSQPQYYRDNHVLSIEKILIYHANWPGMERRSKYNGFENLLPLRRYIENELSQAYPEIEPKLFALDSIRSQLAIR